MWRSLVAHLTGGQGVAGSNPVIPTNLFKELLPPILGFALSGYLLPWDQKAYWATTVTINIARSMPLGEYIVGLLHLGTTLGSLTLLRW